MQPMNRRQFMQQTAALGAAAFGGTILPAFAQKPGGKMRFGLVTYLWAQDWDLPAIIENCAKSDVLGVELRVEHAHKVEPSLTAEQRAEVKKRFADSPVTFVGMGTNQDFDSPDPEELKKSIEGAKEYIKLSHDCGGSGVKVKPNDFQKKVAHEATIEQIGKSLNEVAAFGADYGQQIRLEVHGSCCELPTIKAIMDIATHPNATVCWNCNDQDLKDPGLEANFNTVKARFGDTLHARELNIGDYPYQQLMDLLAAMDYPGWVLLEARTAPADRVAALAEQRKVFAEMLAIAQTKTGK